jgi:hypothetical protein
MYVLVINHQVEDYDRWKAWWTPGRGADRM